MQPVNLVFQGGGIKGLSYIGVLRYLEEEQIPIGYLAGTSVGAMIASLVAVGYDSYELEEIINQLPMSVLLPENERKTTDKILSFVHTKGLYSMQPLENYLDQLFMAKQKRLFSDIKIGNNYKVIMISTCLKLRKMFVLPHDLKVLGIHPDTFPIAKAVCMSACMPFVYEPYYIQGYMFTDGGVSDNFPTWCFQNSLAFQVSEEKQIENFMKKKIFKENEKKHHQQIISINTKEFKSTDFKKGMMSRYLLYNRGYFALKQYHIQLRNGQTKNNA